MYALFGPRAMATHPAFPLVVLATALALSVSTARASFAVWALVAAIAGYSLSGST